MQIWYYEVVSIDGDYANLRRIDIPSDDLKLVARALLPEGIYNGAEPISIALFENSMQMLREIAAEVDEDMDLESET